MSSAAESHKIAKPIKTWLIVVKIAATLLAFYLAFKMVDKEDLKRALKSVDKVLFLAAMLLYILSQALSSERLRMFIGKIPNGHHLSSLWNVKLYWIGMAYNLFLPGGIGGDAYKLAIYHKKFKPRVSQLFTGMLLDRISGVIAIGLLLAAIPLYKEKQFSEYMGIWWWVPALAAFMLCWFLIKSRYKRFKSVFLPTVALSLIIQLMQVGSILLLVHAVGMSGHQPAIMAVFLISSLATAIPVFLGGLGAREIVFGLFAGTFNYSAPEAITASLLFSAVIIITSLPGLILSFKKD